MVKALPEVGVEALSDRRLCQTFPADPHNTFGSARSDRHPPPPSQPTHHQVVISSSSAPLFARVSKKCSRKSDDTTTKMIIELRPRVSWCQVHIWTPTLEVRSLPYLQDLYQLVRIAKTLIKDSSHPNKPLLCAMVREAVLLPQWLLLSLLSHIPIIHIYMLQKV
ncbi:hypothetical protein N1851_014617 [Merluccius polli]|uniref:Uncharacterized protein n=1 Tax=Merluccius polli TaxID=89951 RepID=A0AA47P460_MERPO|nr:hypothetical protein N1851_014617 [Merluccius polli]